MIDTALLLDDVGFAKALLEEDRLSGADMVFNLGNLLKMPYPGFNMCKLCPFLVWVKPKK